MHQLAEARNHDDDWTGLKDGAARRKRQTRLNVRAHRKRKLQQKISCNEVQVGAIQYFQSPPVMKPTHESPDLQGTHLCLHRPPSASCLGASASGLLLPAPTFTPLCPDGTIMLPLSSDHLIPLVQYNVFRAALTNMFLLSITNLISRKCDISTALQTTPIFPSPAVPPPSLAPTTLQRSVPHDIWIDLLPHGIMRDNAIRTMDTFDYENLCSDMVGGYYQGRNDIELTGVLVWANPWHVSGWEVTEGFLKKWGFLLNDCWEIMASTNYWRERRGDDPLVFNI